MQAPGIPPHTLPLKISAIAYVMANLDRTEGFVRGAMSTVIDITQNTIMVQLARNPFNPRRPVWSLARIHFLFQPAPIKITRRQFSLRLA